MYNSEVHKRAKSGTQVGKQERLPKVQSYVRKSPVAQTVSVPLPDLVEDLVIKARHLDIREWTVLDTAGDTAGPIQLLGKAAGPSFKLKA